MGHEARILVVEDEPSVRDVLRESLEDAGCEVVVAANGDEARERLERGAAPCVILLDLMMPGMNGWQFRAWQQEQPRFARVPVVLLSATRDLAGEAKRLETDYLEKPVTFDALLATIDKYCRRGFA